MRAIISKTFRWFAIGALILASAQPAAAQRLSFIRDAEIENNIRSFTAPLLQVAGIPPADVRIHLVRSDAINAFVAGGLRIFINTGTIQKSETPGELIGIIAHEIGHIAGGHLARIRDQLRGASTQTIISAILGIAAAVLTQNAGAAAAVTSFGQDAAIRDLLQYSRTQEQAADQAGLKYLDRTGQSARGLMNILDTLADQELLAVGRQDPYVRTHPITRTRVDAVHAHVAKSRYSDVPYPPEIQMKHQRMRAKLDGFLKPPGTVFRNYPRTDRSLTARYARSVAYYRSRNLQAALDELDGLIADHPQDPYFHELRGQILFENGLVEQALPSYRKAFELSNSDILIGTGLARAAVETGDPRWARYAAELLEKSVEREPEEPGAWRLLGIAHGRSGDIGMASLALGEWAIRTGRFRDATIQATRAQRELKSGTPPWLRAEDIKIAAEAGAAKARQRRR